MARATFVKKARRDYPNAGIKKGDSYFWWKFRFGGKHFSKTRPRRSQLTQSEYYSQMYDIEDEIAAYVADDTLQGAVEDIASRLRDIASECEDKLSNMPDSLQSAPSGELLQNRADACNAAADEFEGIDFDAPEYVEYTEEDEEEEENNQEEIDNFWSEKLDEIQGVSIDIE